MAQPLMGQKFRVFQGSAVIGEAVNCVITLSSNTDESSTKDDTGLSTSPSIVSKSWQVQVESLNVDDVATLIQAMKEAQTFTIGWAQTTGANNATIITTGDDRIYARYGNALLTDATFNFDNRANSVKNLTFTGCGEIHDYIGSQT